MFLYELGVSHCVNIDEDFGLERPSVCVSIVSVNRSGDPKYVLVEYSCGSEVIRPTDQTHLRLLEGRAHVYIPSR